MSSHFAELKARRVESDEILSQPSLVFLLFKFFFSFSLFLKLIFVPQSSFLTKVGVKLNYVLNYL